MNSVALWQELQIILVFGLFSTAMAFLLSWLLPLGLHPNTNHS
jgi:hypothetical protein